MAGRSFTLLTQVAMDHFPLRLASFSFIALKVDVELDPNREFNFWHFIGVGVNPTGGFNFRFFGVMNGLSLCSV